MKNKIPIERMSEFVREIKTIRFMFPELAKEIDRCIYDAGQNNLGSCGHATCDCQMTFERFHELQNIQYGTTSEAKSYEFN